MKPGLFPFTHTRSPIWKFSPELWVSPPLALAADLSAVEALAPAELGLVLGAAAPDGLAILLGTLIPLGLAVLMFPPVIAQTHTKLVSVSGYRLTPDHEKNWLQLCDGKVVLAAQK